MTPMPGISDRPSNSALANADRANRMQLLRQYLRQQGPALVPNLPDELRTPTNFIMRQVKSVSDGLDMPSAGSTADDLLPAFLSPVLSLMHPSGDDTAETMWLSPGYHHMHGMLPFDDAITLGFNYRNSMFGNRLKFGLHPFYAQNWHSADDYWGIETALAIGPDADRSWGKLVLRYNNGSSDLLEHGSGYDLHADFSFNENLNLSAGARQNEDSDAGNYVLLRWKMPLND